MIPYEIASAILHYSDLETCVSFSDACKQFQEITASLDDSILHSKVKERAPWMHLEDGLFPTWFKCARVIIARNTLSLNWAPADDFNSVFSTCKAENVFLEPENTPGALPESFEPIFSDLIKCPINGVESVGTSFKGESLVCEDIYGDELKWSELNLKTLEMNVYKQPHEGDVGQSVLEPPKKPLRTFKCENYFGNGDNVVTVLAETDTVMHLVLDRGNLIDEYIVFKPTFNEEQFLEDSLEVPCKPKSPNLLTLPGYSGINQVHFFPDSNKVLLSWHGRERHYGLHESPDVESTWLYMVDMSPGVENRVQFLTVIPSRPVNWSDWIRAHGDRSEYPANLDFELLTFDGYLYVFCKGRFVRLWIDLNSEGEGSTRLSRDLLGDRDMLKCSRRARVTFDKEVPLVQGIDGFLPVTKSDRAVYLVRGKSGLERYTTLSGTSGRLIGDLQTGTTYIAKDRAKARRWRGFLFAGIKEGQVHYYRWKKEIGREVCQLVIEKTDSEPLGQIDIKQDIGDIFNKYPVEEWEFVECSDYDYFLGIYGSVGWWPITLHSHGISQRVTDAIKWKLEQVYREFVADEDLESENE